jgi:hypothetical protein
MAEEHQVHIVSWPPEPAELEHHFPQGENVPVSISFESTPARVVIASLRDSPLGVNMNMNLRAPETLPLCVRLCEPICAESDYTIGITIFDRPVITITIRGTTRLFGCREEL